ncbi:MAG TPA: lipid-binding SYLF domain-containing protein [Verrucomicrobiae bacterium]|nr:lipid-binding SYLF domain-containing protein [Verrucomicrobiae bacterium]
MQTLIMLLVCSAISAGAAEKWELDNRIRSLSAKFDVLEHKSDKMVPPEVLRQARGIVLLDRTKAGVVFAYQGGAGVSMARDPRTGGWSPVAFVSANEASFGAQIGAEQDFVVILLMTTNADHYLTEPSFNFGGEARGTAGDTTAGAGSTVYTQEHPILVYDDRTGLYGGAAIKGGAVTPDDDANRTYYGRFVTMKDILFGRVVKPSQSALDLAATLDAYSRPPPTAAR